MAQTEEQIMEKIKNLLNNERESMIVHARKLISSGALDLENADDNFRLPKIIFTVVLRYAVTQYTPHTKDAKKILRNLEHF